MSEVYRATPGEAAEFASATGVKIPNPDWVCTECRYRFYHHPECSVARDFSPFRLAEEGEVEALRPLAAADGVNLEPSDSARPTTWWAMDHPFGMGIVAVCGMMPVEGNGQRLRGSWVAPDWRRRGIWWAMVQFRVGEAWERGAEFVETYAVHPGPLLRRGWEVATTKHKNGAVHVSRRPWPYGRTASDQSHSGT
jgi:GNAT superfamily N-acetyltransferase